MRIGVDFDNTIAGYERLFADLAREAGLVEAMPKGGAKGLRDLLWQQRADGDVVWQHLQALAYGQRMAEAEMIDGVAAFLADCRDRQWPVFIISHKTQFARRDVAQQYDMRQAALDWMQSQAFFDEGGLGIDRRHVFFENTQEAKVRRIAELACDVFIDDLLPVLTHPLFPPSVRRYWLAAEPDGSAPTDIGEPIRHCSSWEAIRRDIARA